MDCLDSVMLLLTVKVRNRFNTFAITVTHTEQKSLYTVQQPSVMRKHTPYPRGLHECMINIKHLCLPTPLRNFMDKTHQFIYIQS